MSNEPDGQQAPGGTTGGTTPPPSPQVNPTPPAEQQQPSADPAWLAPRLERAREAGRREGETAAREQSTSEVEQLRQQVTELTSQLGTLTSSLDNERLNVQRAQVAAAKKVPARYVTGDTEEEMNAAADQFLADAKGAAKPGFIPSQGTGKPDAQVSSYELGRERAEARYRKN